MSRTGAKKLTLAFIDGDITRFGGVFLLHQFLQHLRFRSFLHQSFRYGERNNRYSVSERIFALMYPMILGMDSIEVSSLLGHNGVFQFITGLPSFPNPTTLRRFLIDKAEILYPKLHAVHNKLREHFLNIPHTRSSYWIDFDSTQKTLYGSQEGAEKGYNTKNRGKKSYHPLICTEGRLRDCLGGLLRNGNIYTAVGVGEMLDEVYGLLPQRERLRVRADCGFYEKEFIEALEKRNIGFTIVARMTAPLQRKAQVLSYKKVNNLEGTARFNYQPTGWLRQYSFVALREKLTPERKEQVSLFEMNDYSYHVLVTNLDLDPYNAFNFYEDRTEIERVIRTLTSDYPFATAPTDNFLANKMYAEISLLAYNIVTWFKRTCLPDKWHSYTVETMRNKLLSIPGILISSGNRRILQLSNNNPHREVIEQAIKKIGNLPPLI
jgi:hypothetical protein